MNLWAPLTWHIPPSLKIAEACDLGQNMSMRGKGGPEKPHPLTPACNLGLVCILCITCQLKQLSQASSKLSSSQIPKSGLTSFYSLARLNWVTQNSIRLKNLSLQGEWTWVRDSELYPNKAEIHFSAVSFLWPILGHHIHHILLMRSKSPVQLSFTFTWGEMRLQLLHGSISENLQM